MPKTGFQPSLHGFHFANNFNNVLVNTPFGNISSGGGRCGGMAYTALDYFFHHAPIPNCIDNDSIGIHDFSSSGGVPPDGTILADFIMLRLMTTFAQYGYTSACWNSASDHSTSGFLGIGGGPGVVPATKGSEWPKLKARLDQGTPVAIGLVSTTGNIGDAHQIVAYDYNITTDANGNQIIVISVYDNNLPDDDTVAIISTVDTWTNPHWNEVNSSGPVMDAGAPIIWRGFWVEDGTPASWFGVASWMVPIMATAIASIIVGIGSMAGLWAALIFFGFSPGSTEQELLSDVIQLIESTPNAGTATPPLVDLVLTQSVAPASAEELIGDSYGPQLIIMNQSPYMAHAQFLSLISGTTQLDSILQDSTNPLSLSPGQSFVPSIGAKIPSTVIPGTYNMTVQYMTMEQHSIVLPTVSGAVNSASLMVFPSPTLSVSVVAEIQGTTQLLAGGVVTGGYKVEMQASPAPSEFAPVSYKWTIDAGTPVQQMASGQTITVFVPIGSKGQPLVYAHTVSVTAADSKGLSATATYMLIFTKPTGYLTSKVDPQSTNKTTITQSGTGTDWIRTSVTTYSLMDAALSQLLYFFDPVSISWAPQPTGLVGGNNGGYAVYPVNGGNLQVSATITDEIGQKLVLTVELEGSSVTVAKGPGWKPPKVPGMGDQNPNSNPLFVPPPSWGSDKNTSNKRISRLVTGAELESHVALVRQFAKDIPAGRSNKAVTD